MKCPNCSFNNIASAATCKICGTELEVIPGANNDTLALDEALKGIFAPKIPSPSATPVLETEEDHTSSWEPLDEEESTEKESTGERPTGEKPTEKESAEESAALQAGAHKIPETASIEEETITTQSTRKIYEHGVPLQTLDHPAASAEKEKKEIFVNPLTSAPAKEEEPETPQNFRKAVIPVYESAKEGIDIDEEAENFFALPKDTTESKLVAPEKRRRSKTDEIAAIAMVILLICLGTLIYFAVQMSKKPDAPRITTTPPISSITTPEQSSGSSSTTTTTSSTTTSTSSEKDTTSSTGTTFDDGYFTRTGNLSGGNGTEDDALIKVRMGDHHYYHRFVFDFVGNKIPTYYVSILDGGYLVQLRVENITDFTREYGIDSWSTVAKSIEIVADTSTSVLINIYMNEPAMIHTYGLEEPGRIVLDIRGDSNKD